MDHHLNMGNVNAAASGMGAALSFMTSAMPVLQFVAVIVSITTGVFAIRYYSRKLSENQNGNI